MRVDAHVHLQPHGEAPPVDRARIEQYVHCAQANGVDVVVFTEHLFRFREAYALLDGWWNDDPNPRLAAATQAYWQDHVNLSLSEYVYLIEQAKADGLSVRLGMELDWIPGRAEDLRSILKPYEWDCLLGSVHSIGGFLFDVEEEIGEWDNREVESVWDEYGQLIEDLADARLVDVLAHPDVVKVFGFRPADEEPLRRRIVAAAKRNGLALEVNTNGLRKPAAELYPHPETLRAARAAGVPITLASDAHMPERIGLRFADGIAAARAAGYDGYLVFERRKPHTEAFW